MSSLFKRTQGNQIEGMDIGDVNYAFLHGHGLQRDIVHTRVAAMNGKAHPFSFR